MGQTFPIDAVVSWLKQTLAKPVVISNANILSGGAIQENWAVDISIDGAPIIQTVLRCDAASSVSDSLSREQEYALLKTAFEAGVTVPEPLWLGDSSVFGRAFFIMRRAQGVAAGHKLVKDLSIASDRSELVRQVGREMARIHSIKPATADLDFLAQPQLHPAQLFINESRQFLDDYHTAFPALEWGLTWLEKNLPEQEALCLVHRDFRTGNFMADEQGLTAVLDWEFAGWGHALEDLGWFCARCWRFGQKGAAYAAGGLASKQALIEGYTDISGRSVTEEQIYFWEVYAHVRWAVIAIKQGERHVSGQELSLELALTAHIVPELELHILRMTGIDYTGEIHAS